MVDDYFYLEPLIISRLQSALPDLPILSSKDLSTLQDRTQPNVAIHVMYAGDNIQDDAALRHSSLTGTNYHQQKVLQYWMIVLAIRNVRDGNTSTGTPLQLDAGQLLIAVIKALGGWKPDDALDYLTRSKGNNSPTYHNGFAYYPLRFETFFITSTGE